MQLCPTCTWFQISWRCLPRKMGHSCSIQGLFHRVELVFNDRPLMLCPMVITSVQNVFVDLDLDKCMSKCLIHVKRFTL